ncbi:MAG: efflux RND transporter periplasmic adaptor subunit [Deltaproteobacteria bacterium]|nr:efflux RND transporter periplasmic adaptor subunit [Deltaproteobacteria bacterium]
MEAVRAKGNLPSRSAGKNRHHLPDRVFHLATVLLLAVLLLAGCSTEETKAKPPATIPVSAATAQERNVPVQLKTIGSVEASQRVSIRSRIGGALTRIAFQEGQDVQQGKVLFLIDPRPYERAVAAALANLARDQVQLANAEKEAFRYGELNREALVAKQQYDQVLTAREVLRNTVRSDEAALEAARLNLQYCYITAPIAGRTGVVTVHVGDQIEADGAEMVSINRITPVNVNFSLPEKHLPAIRAYALAGNLPAAATLPHDPEKTSPGILSFINNAIDPATGTILLKATFPNTDKRLWPGQFVNVALTLTVRQRSVVVPSRAIQMGQQGPFVFVVKPDLTVESRPIAPGQEIDGATVIEKGLQAGETVVTDGQLRLVPGARVEIKTVGREKRGSPSP